MKTKTFDQYVAVSGEDFQTAVDRLNKTIKEHAYDYIGNTMIDSCNYLVHYRESVAIPETKADERELEGKTVHCVDCPHYRPILNADGSADKRTKYAMCSKWGYKIMQDGVADDKCYRFLSEEAELEKQQFNDKEGITRSEHDTSRLGYLPI